MNQMPFSRKQFLRAAAGSLALPVLPSLRPREARGAGPLIPKRVLLLGHEYGHLLQYFYPEAPADERHADDVYFKKLTDLPGPISHILGPTFDRYRSRMNIYRGLDATAGAGHNSTVAFSGASHQKGDDKLPLAYGQSIDSLLHASSAIYPQAPRIRSVRAGSLKWSWDRGEGGVAFKLPYFSSDTALYDYLFSSAVVDPAAAKLESQQRSLVVGGLRARIKALSLNKRLSALDRQRLERHIASMSELERAVQPVARPGGGQCMLPTANPYKPAVQPTETLYRNYADALVAAFDCDLTRVAVMTINDFTEDKKRSRADFHGNSHDREKTTRPAPLADASTFSRWLADRIVYVLDKLDSVVEADGSRMLDNTLVLWATELSQGNDHRGESLPVVTIGNAGNAALKTGYYLDYRQKPLVYNAGRKDFPPMGRSYTQLLVTVMRTMGLQPGEYMSAGDGGGFGQFDDTHPYTNGKYKPYRLQRNSPLPFVFG